jgi:hypothetical protein
VVFFELLGELAPKNYSMNMLAGYMPEGKIWAGATPRACIRGHYII